jgi:hypothetical protein
LGGFASRPSRPDLGQRAGILADARFASAIDPTGPPRTTPGSDGKVKPSFTTLLAIATPSMPSWSRRVSPQSRI